MSSIEDLASRFRSLARRQSLLILVSAFAIAFMIVGLAGLSYTVSTQNARLEGRLDQAQEAADANRDGLKAANRRLRQNNIKPIPEPPMPSVISGLDGLNGRDGIDGQDGLDGQIGPRGPQGPAGRNGKNGANGEGVSGSNGADGSQGPPGPTGPPGADGKDGLDGQSPYPLVFVFDVPGALPGSSTTYTITCTMDGCTTN